MANNREKSNTVIHDELANFLVDRIDADIKSISIIGSYLIDRCVGPGSDIDTVVVVGDLDSAKAEFHDKIFYKNTIIEDSQGRRQEMNVRFGEIPIDITIIDPDSTNPPNNPLTDYYENFLGLCKSGLSIYGGSLRETLDYDSRIIEYENVRDRRLRLVEEKIDLTREKIINQRRSDLHIIYEMQRYVFIRECISQRIFNRLSIKRPELSIPEFDEIFARELGLCGISLAISRSKDESSSIE